MRGANPTTVIIFGATGDLFRKKLAPALWRMFECGLLPEVFRLVAFSRRPWGQDEFRKFFREVMGGAAAPPPALLEKFLENVIYIEGNLNTLPSYEKTAALLGKIDTEVGVCTNKLFYLATPPTSYEGILKNISASGLAIPCAPTKDGSETGWTRVLVEKPFGANSAQAVAVDRLLADLFSENQIFRIDHYLAKDILRDIINFRFADGSFESVWNNEHIAAIDIRLYEKGDVSERGVFYDALGAILDVGQNHALQMAVLAAMEKPPALSGEAVREARAASLRQFKFQKAARAQYDGYRSEKGVTPDSKTETYFKLELALPSPRWQGVPFTLEGGKCLPASKAEIVVAFKKPEKVSVGAAACSVSAVNFQIQPAGKIFLQDAGDASQEFSPAVKNPAGEGGVKNAYERVLSDAIRGDQTLFASTAEVQAEWGIIAPVLESWRGAAAAAAPLPKYPCGTMPEV